MSLLKKYQSGTSGVYYTTDPIALTGLKESEADSAKVFNYFKELESKLKTLNTQEEKVKAYQDYTEKNRSYEATVIVPAIKRLEAKNNQPFNISSFEDIKQPKKVVLKTVAASVPKIEEVKKEKPKVDKMPMRAALSIVEISPSKELKPKIELEENSPTKEFKDAIYKYVTVITTDKDGNKTVTREKSTVPYAYKLEGVGNWILNDEAQDVIYRTIE
jgi:hypothetical protein